MKSHLDLLVKDLQTLFGNKLVSVILYGSAAKKQHLPQKSDVNVLVVLKEVHLSDLSLARKCVAIAQKKINLAPVFWSEQEIGRGADTFPLEFRDIQESYEVLAGKDVVGEVAVSTRNLRHQVEAELTSKLLQMRVLWLTLQSSPRDMEAFLGQAGKSLNHLAKECQFMCRGKLGPALLHPMEQCAKLRKKEIKLNKQALAGLYFSLYDAVGRLLQNLESI